MEYRFEVQGMTCGHCARAVTEAVKRVDASAQVEVDLSGGRVDVRSEAGREPIAAAIREEGYPVKA
jgi:copper chaperone